MQSASDDTTQLLALTRRPPVLLVEDDEATRALFAARLRTEGFSVSEALSAEDALNVLRAQFFPIVVTDINLPGMDGLALCQQLRTAKLPGYVYIVVITGYDADEGVVAALNAGADDYLQKSVSRAELAARLQTAERIVSLEQRLRMTLGAQRHLASSDPLTGLPNRRAFDKQFNTDFKRAVRFKENLAVLILDLDHFKLINDRYGHAAGDDMLKQFAARVRSSLPRTFDFLARLGGEEFALLLPQTDLAGALRVAERLRLAIAETPFQIADHSVSMTVSIGVNALNERVNHETLTPEDVLELADQCLYASKKAGRNRVSGVTVDFT